MGNPISNFKSWGELQRKAVIVLIICFVVLVATIVGVSVALQATKDETADEVITEEYSADAYVLDQESSAIVPESGEPSEDALKDVLFVGESRVTQMNMDVDKSRCRTQSAGVDLFGLLVSRQVGSHFGDAITFHQNISHKVQRRLAGWVQNSGIFYQKLFH